MNTTQPPPIASKALEANFQQTASAVAISPRYAPLREAVARYQGLSARLEHLLYEISHPFRNWQLIIAELRPFVLKNLNHYLGHAQGPDCFALFSSIFIDALKDSRKSSKVASQTIKVLACLCRQTDQLAHAAGFSETGQHSLPEISFLTNVANRNKFGSCPSFLSPYPRKNR